jgi:hypothetical protein
MEKPVVLHPAQERSPARVVDAFREMAVALQVAYLQVLEGNQVVRADKRACLFAGKILALPLDLQIRLRQSFSGFLSVL